MVFQVPQALRRRIRAFVDSVGIEPVIQSTIVPVVVVDSFNDVIPEAAPGSVLPTTLSHREFTFIWVPMGNGVVITVPDTGNDQSILSIPGDSPYRYRVESIEVTVTTGTVTPTGAAPVSVYLHPFQVDTPQSSFHAFNNQFWGGGPDGSAYPPNSRLVLRFARFPGAEVSRDQNYGWITPVSRTVTQQLHLPDMWLSPGGALRVSIVPGVAFADLTEVAILAILTGVARG